MRKGFTILEGLIAVILLVIALPAITSLFVGAKSSQVGSFAVEQGAQFAEGRVDSLRWLGRQVLAGDHALGTYSANQVTYLSLKNATWKWKLDTAVNATAGAPGAAGSVTVEVDWNQSGHAHSISLQGEVP
jgi:Tfp pilus assembly protein PilV